MLCARSVINVKHMSNHILKSKYMYICVFTLNMLLKSTSLYFVNNIRVKVMAPTSSTGPQARVFDRHPFRYIRVDKAI